MARVHLIHGFNVWDGGEGSIGKLKPFFESAGYEVIVHDYGWSFLFLLRLKNSDAVEQIQEFVEPGDILVGHSNGCLICWHIANRMESLGAVICIQPALRRDTLWPEELPVLCLCNKRDFVVLLGRIWGRFASVVNPWSGRHGWGSAGWYGFTSKQPSVEVKRTCCGWGKLAACGHSGAMKYPPIKFWGYYMAQWALGRVS